MEFYPLVNGKKLPEVYHFGYSGTHFQIFLNPVYWFKFVDLTEKGTYYASHQGGAYVPPVVTGGSFGQNGCATVLHTLDGFACIEIPAFLEDSDDEDAYDDIRILGNTLANILFILQHLLSEADKMTDEFEQGDHLQLFILETVVAREPGQSHGAGLGLSLSPQARKYLEHLGDNIVLDDAVVSMREHYHKYSKTPPKLFRGEMEVRLRTNGVLHMHTIGQCACMGTMPQDFGERGCYLLSHNVDTVFQQFNLLVGIASVWQMVRDGLRNQVA